MTVADFNTDTNTDIVAPMLIYQHRSHGINILILIRILMLWLLLSPPLPIIHPLGPLTLPLLLWISIRSAVNTKRRINVYLKFIDILCILELVQICCWLLENCFHLVTISFFLFHLWSSCIDFNDQQCWLDILCEIQSIPKCCSNTRTKNINFF